MSNQRGFGLSQVLLWGVVLGVIAVGAMKVAPSFIEYQTILRAVKSVAANANAQTTVAQVKSSFSKQMDVDNINSIRPDDLDIYKENNQIVISFAYDKILPLFGPVNLLIKYAGSSQAVTE
jgi:ribosomal protein L31E